jgi:hypothetical protein
VKRKEKKKHYLKHTIVKVLVTWKMLQTQPTQGSKRVGFFETKLFLLTHPNLVLLLHFTSNLTDSVIFTRWVQFL